MTEWNAAHYERIAGLQLAMANEVLHRLSLKGSERVLDVGCGSGKITAAIAGRLPMGSVLGVDASHEMVTFAGNHYCGPDHPNLSFEVADASTLPFSGRFDLVVSFNALHWIRDHGPVLRGIHAALKPGGMAHLRFVPAGPRKSLEDVIEDDAA